MLDGLRAICFFANTFTFRLFTWVSDMHDVLAPYEDEELEA